MRAWMLQLWLALMLACGWLSVALLPAELGVMLMGAGLLLLILFGGLLSWQMQGFRIQGGWQGFLVGWLLPMPSRWIRPMQIGMLEVITLSLIAIEVGAITHILIKAV